MAPYQILGRKTTLSQLKSRQMLRHYGNRSHVMPALRSTQLREEMFCLGNRDINDCFFLFERKTWEKFVYCSYEALVVEQLRLVSSGFCIMTINFVLILCCNCHHSLQLMARFPFPSVSSRSQRPARKWFGDFLNFFWTVETVQMRKADVMLGSYR